MKTRSLTGSSIGPYQVEELIGAGGMGEVYRARDPRLQRDVAIKILPDAFALDDDRLRRFEREARVLASLDHRHIASIYGLEEVGGTRALVLELVEGPTLADRIGKGPVPIDEALTIARQIADGLESAHDQGVVHRDLKPANIKIRPDGTVKILDFGLAKAVVGDANEADAANTPTITGMATREGIVLGTAAYMSPEQARGRAVDRRTDVWAFGCVLYEMLTGRAPFAGESVTDSLANIIHRDPEWDALPASTPQRIRELLRRCLQKDPRNRQRDMGDVRLEIEEAIARLGSPSMAEGALGQGSRRGSAPPLWLLLAAGIGGAAVALAATRMVSWGAAEDPVPRFDRFTRFVSTAAQEFAPALSPDGKWVAYLSNARGPTDVWVKFIEGGGDARNLTASSAFDVQTVDAVGGPQIKPDGSEIAFNAGPPGARPNQMSTWVIPAPLGGSARRFLPPGNSGMQWSRDGRRIAYVRPGSSLGDALWIADADGQNARELVRREGGRHLHWVRWSGDGQFLYFNYGLMTLNNQGSELFRVPVSGGSVQPVVRSLRRAAFPFPTRDGRGLFYAANPDSVDSALWWRDLRTGRDYRITSGVGEYAEPYASDDGQRLVGIVTDVRQALHRVATDGSTAAPQPLTDGFTGDLDPGWSPDGTRIVFSSSRGGSRNIWSARADLSEPSPLAPFDALDERPMYSPDALQIAFVSDRGGERGIWVMNADGGRPKRVVAAPVLDTISWSPDGRRLVYAVPGGDAPGLVTVDVASGRTSPLRTPASASAPAWSPREDVIAYLEPKEGFGTNIRFVTGDGRVHGPDFPNVPEGMAINNGFLSWSRDGRRLAAVGLPGYLAGYILIVEPGSRTPFHKLLDLPAGVMLRGVTWSRDGRSLVMGQIRFAHDILLAERRQ